MVFVRFLGRKKQIWDGSCPLCPQASRGYVPAKDVQISARESTFVGGLLLWVIMMSLAIVLLCREAINTSRPPDNQ